MELKDIITIVCSSTFGTILGMFFSHILYNSKLKKEQRIKIIGDISQKRISCIDEIQQILTELKIIERIDIVHPESEINKPLSYPSVLENYKNFENFSKKYNSIAKKYSDLLNQKCLMDLYIGTNYINNLRIVAYTLFKNENLHILGTFIYPEIEKWTMRFKDDLNCLLNNPPLKYEKRTGIKYNLKLELVTFKVKHSLLYRQFIKNTELEDEKIGNVFARNMKNRKINKEINKSLSEKIL